MHSLCLLCLDPRLGSSAQIRNLLSLVRLTEVIESESGARSVMTTESPLRGTPQYEVFFRGLIQLSWLRDFGIMAVVVGIPVGGVVGWFVKTNSWADIPFKPVIAALRRD